MALCLPSNSDDEHLPLPAVVVISPETEEVPPKRRSLLVDYSSNKAKLGDQDNLFPDSNRSLELKQLALQLSKNFDQSFSISDDEVSMASEDSFAHDDDDEPNNPSVCFCVRRSSFQLSTSVSFDERKLSSYDHLQNSLSAMIKAEDHDDDKTIQMNRRASTSDAPWDRRLSLARSRSCATKSMSNLDADKKLSPTTARPSPARVLRRTKSIKDVAAVLGKCSLHSHQGSRMLPDLQSSAHNNKSPSTVHRRSQLARSKSSRCTSCSNILQTAKSLNDSAPISLAVLVNGFSLSKSGPLDGTTAHTTASSKRDTTKRRASLALLATKPKHPHHHQVRNFTMNDGSESSSNFDMNRRGSNIRRFSDRSDRRTASALQKSLLNFNFHIVENDPDDEAMFAKKSPQPKHPRVRDCQRSNKRRNN